MSAVSNIKKIAVIGGGPSGAAVTKYLVAENKFSEIVVFEQRSATGGIWNTDSRSLAVDANAFPSPIYHTMESNIPSEIMQYNQQPFPPGTPLLPDAGTVLDYLRNYAEPVLPNIKFRHEVLDATPVQSDDKTTWKVTVRDLQSDAISEDSYDAVVVASGRYNKPHVPEIRGLESWKQAYPSSIMHSKFYRDPAPFQDKKVVIIGFSSSGVDLANEIGPVCRNPLLISQKSVDGLSPGSKGFEEAKTVLPEIIELDAVDRSVIFANSREERDVDYIIFCTGYEYDYPFLSSLPGFSGGDGDGNTRTFQHIFHVDFPTLAFVLLPLRVAAFPFAETQAAVIAAVLSERVRLPPLESMEGWVRHRGELTGGGKAFHKLSYPADADYMEEMYNWCHSAHAKNSPKSLSPPFWGERERWLRQSLHSIRRAVEARGEERFAVKSVEDVGFHFDPASIPPKKGLKKMAASPSRTRMTACLSRAP